MLRQQNRYQLRSDQRQTGSPHQQHLQQQTQKHQHQRWLSMRHPKQYPPQRGCHLLRRSSHCHILGAEERCLPNLQCSHQIPCQQQQLRYGIHCLLCQISLSQFLLAKLRPQHRSRLRLHQHQPEWPCQQNRCPLRSRQRQTESLRQQNRCPLRLRQRPTGWLRQQSRCQLRLRQHQTEWPRQQNRCQLRSGRCQLA